MLIPNPRMTFRGMPRLYLDRLLAVKEKRTACRKTMHQPRSRRRPCIDRSSRAGLNWEGTSSRSLSLRRKYLRMSSEDAGIVVQRPSRVKAALFVPGNFLPDGRSLAVEELRAIDVSFFKLLFERSSDFCFNNPTGSHRENIQYHRLFDYFLLHAGLYVFCPSSFGTLGWNVARRSLFYLLLVSWRD